MKSGWMSRGMCCRPCRGQPWRDTLPALPPAIAAGDQERLARQKERHRGFYVYGKEDRRDEAGRIESGAMVGADSTKVRREVREGHEGERTAAEPPSATVDMPPSTPRSARRKSNGGSCCPWSTRPRRLLAEGVTDSTDVIDLATVLGTGLAPFRGGLAHFADSRRRGCAGHEDGSDGRPARPAFRARADAARVGRSHHPLVGIRRRRRSAAIHRAGRAVERDEFQ